MCYWSARLAYADRLYRRDDRESAARAVRLDPGNARYLSWMAEIEEHEGGDPAPWLERAAALNPRDSGIAIRRGLLAEQRRDFAGAECHLLHAARVDRQFEPRATLAQYYFRRGNAAQFWRWMREAFRMSYGDATPLFQLCWRMTDDAAVVRAALPQTGALWGSYLKFLLSQDRLDAAAAIAGDLALQARPNDLAILLDGCDRFLQSGHWSAALATWNLLCGRLLPHPPLAPLKGISLTNGGFAAEPVLHGFDWRIPAPPEIAVTRAEAPPALHIALSGRQPETCDLLSQYVPLDRHRRYRFQFQYRTTGLPPDSGLRWRVLAAEAPVPAAPAWRTADLRFDSGESELALFTLVYIRPAGSPRAEGSLALRDAVLEFHP